jgi:hypothetical protein
MSRAGSGVLDLRSMSFRAVIAGARLAGLMPGRQRFVECRPAVYLTFDAQQARKRVEEGANEP